MASSNIKLFDENKGNMLSDSEFSISNQRMNGLQTGVASSQLQNKAMYQVSLVAYAIAQVMMQNGLNANDTDAVSTFVANLSGTMLQKVYDIATTAEAQAGVATGKWMSPALTKTFFNYMEATTPEAQEGTNNTKWMSPALVKAAIDTLAAKAQNILSDATKSLYGLRVTATPNDVFAKLAMPHGYYGFDVTTVFPNGTPAPNIVLRGLEDLSGNQITTDENGRYKTAVAATKTPTVTISGCIGVADKEVVITSEDGVVFTPVTITVEIDTSMRLIQSSQELTVITGYPVDMCIVGGGASGYYEKPTYTDHFRYPGGGGGYAKNILNVVLTKPTITLKVGAGGISNVGRYGAGGTTSIQYNDTTETVDGATSNKGNGNGSVGAPGTNGTVHVFNDDSLPIPGGGGGSGETNTSTRIAGGLDFGGGGGFIYNGARYDKGEDGKGPGGGGGGGVGQSDQVYARGGNGASGGLYIRVKNMG